MAEYYYPCTPWHLYNANAGQFLAEAYFRATGSDHTGVDINGNGGGDTDFNDTIRSITDGVVVTAKYYPVWGNIILIYHPGPKVWSQYAHLNTMSVKENQVVKAGQKIGSMGKGANRRYLSHLHFEIRYKPLPADYWPSAIFKNRGEARSFILDHYVDGIKFLVKNNAKVVYNEPQSQR